MAQRLQQPAHAKAVLRRAEEHRHDQPLVHLPHQVGEHGVAAGGHVGEQLFQQVVIEVGHLFQHMKPRLRLGVAQVAGNFHLCRGLVRPVDEGALQRQVDEAIDLFALPGRNLSGDQRRGADRGQGGEQVRQSAAGQVHLVDEQRMRHTQPFQFAQRRLQQAGLGGVGLGHHHRQIDGRQGGVQVGAEFQRTGAVDHAIAVPHELKAGEVQLDGVAAGAGLGAGIAHLVAADPSLHRPGDLQQGFHQGGLAAAGGAHERQRAHGPRGWASCQDRPRCLDRHVVLPSPWAPGTHLPGRRAHPWRGFWGGRGPMQGLAPP